MKALSLNSAVRVLLTPFGREILEKQHENLLKNLPEGAKDRFNNFVPHPPDEDGYSVFLLWTLFERFGPYIGMTKDPPFYLDILIEDKYLIDARELPYGN